MIEERIILVVDDDEEVRDTVGLLFEGSGQKIIYAENGTQAFELILNDFVDVVVTDLLMSGGCGDKLLKDINSLPQDDRPLVFIISGMLSAREKEGYPVAVESVYAKPFDLDVLYKDVWGKIYKKC